MPPEQLLDPEKKGRFLQEEGDLIVGLKTNNEESYEEELDQYDSKSAKSYLRIKREEYSAQVAGSAPQTNFPGNHAHEKDGIPNPKKETEKDDRIIQRQNKIFSKLEELEDPLALILERLEEPRIRRERREIVQKALKIICQKLNAQTASIFLYSKDRVLKRAGIYGFDREGRVLGENWENEEADEWYSEEKYIVGTSFTGRAADPRVVGVKTHGEEPKYGALQYSSDLMNEDLNPETKSEYLKKFGALRYGIAIPLNGQNRTFGVLRILNKLGSNGVELASSPFSEEDVRHSLYLATNVANALSKFRRDIQLDIFKCLSHLQRNFPDHRGKTYLKEKCQQILDLLIKNPETPFKASVLRIKCISDEGIEVLDPVVSLADQVSNNRDNTPRERGSDGFLWLVADYRKRLILQKLQDEDVIQEFSYRNQQWIRDNNFQSFGCFPLVAGGETVGTISLYTGYKYEFDADVVEFLLGIVDLLAALIVKAIPSPKSEKKFKDLYKQWKHDTKAVGPIYEQCIDASYQKIIGIGPSVIPLILRQLYKESEEPDYWFWALRALTNVNPVDSEDRGKILKMVQAWLMWGEKQGYEIR